MIMITRIMNKKHADILNESPEPLDISTLKQNGGKFEILFKYNPKTNFITFREKNYANYKNYK